MQYLNNKMLLKFKQQIMGIKIIRKQMYNLAQS